MHHSNSLLCTHTGGYRGNDDTKYATHFLRSAQLNAFLPLMENGGGGEHRPWMYEVRGCVVLCLYVEVNVQSFLDA